MSEVSPDAVDLAALTTLTVVAEAGSMSAASARLGITQQAVSLRIRKLERSLGLELLTRRASGTTLTGDGTLIAEWASDVVSAAGRFAALATGLAAADRDGVRIAGSLTIAEQLLPGWLFQLDPSLTPVPTFVATNSAGVIARVRERVVDLGFIETPDVPDDLATQVVASDELVVVVRPDHPWVERRSISARELARTPLVVREAGSGTRQTLERALRAHRPGLEPAAPAAVLPTSSGVLAAVALSGNPAVLSILAVRDALRAGTLRRVRIGDLRITRPLSAVWVPGAPPVGAAERLLDVALHAPPV